MKNCRKDQNAIARGAKVEEIKAEQQAQKAAETPMAEDRTKIRIWKTNTDFEENRGTMTFLQHQQIYTS